MAGIMSGRPAGALGLATSLVLAAGVVVGLAGPAQAQPNGSQNFTNAKIADVGVRYVGQSRRTGYNQPGECIKWVQSWVQEAGGNLPGGGPITGYRKAGAVEISAQQARRGDIFQISNGDSYGGRPHTGVLLGAREGDGSFSVVEGNVPAGSGKVRTHRRVLTAPSGHQLRFWRIGKVASDPPPSISVGQGAGNRQPYIDAYHRAGGANAIGNPVNEVHTWFGGCIQDFRGGSSGAAAIMSRNCNGSTHPVTHGFWSHVAAYNGRGAEVLGYPTNDVHRWGDGWVQDFDGGKRGWNILMRGDRVHRVHDLLGGIKDKYIQTGGPGRWGFPRTEEYAWNGETRQDYEAGSIIWNPRDGARPMAQQDHWYKVVNTGRDGLNARTGPGTNYSRVRNIPNGTSINISCQARGGNVNGTTIWDRLTDGTWVTDYYVNTPRYNDFSPGIPRC